MFLAKSLPALLTALTALDAAALPTEYEPISAIPHIPYPWRRSPHSNSEPNPDHPINALPPALLPRDSETTYEPISAIPHISYPWARSPHSKSDSDPPSDLTPAADILPRGGGNTFPHPHWYLLSCLGSTTAYQTTECASYGYNCTDKGILSHQKATVEYTPCETDCKCVAPEPYQTCFEEAGARRCISNKLVDDGEVE